MLKGAVRSRSQLPLFLLVYCSPQLLTLSRFAEEIFALFGQERNRVLDGHADVARLITEVAPRFLIGEARVARQRIERVACKERGFVANLIV